MNYYPFHIGDYAAHTAHLTPIEDIAYRRCIDLYYLHERALPMDLAEVARLIRMREHADVVAEVVREFFAQGTDGWYHDRCADEIERMQDKQVKAQASAAASVAARRAKAERPLNERSTDAQRTLNDRSTDAELPTPTPTPTPKEKNTGASAKRAKPAVSQPEGVSETVWLDFVAMRKAKRAPLTQTALDGIAREAAKAGLTLEKALAECCSRGWQGFKADWMAPKLVGHGVQVDIARMTTPGPVGPDPTLEKLRRDRLNAVPPSAEIRQKLAELKRGGAV